MWAHGESLFETSETQTAIKRFDYIRSEGIPIGGENMFFVTNEKNQALTSTISGKGRHRAKVKCKVMPEKGCKF